MMEKKRVIIDTDPGVDDINAILFALLCNEFEVEAITTVHGNVDVDTGTRNALYMVEHFGNGSIPVYRGAARSMVGGLPKDATILHGDDGMGNTGLAKPTLKRQDESGVSALIRHVMAAPGEITLLVLGPQTNIALAIRGEPDFASAVKEIIFMGGRITPRENVNPLVTFNIGEDPEAAHIVLQETETPVTMLSQETAFEIRFDPMRLERFAGLGTEAGELAAAISKFYVEQQMKLTGVPGGSIPDLAVMAYALRPKLFDHRELWVDVDITNGVNRGVTTAGSPSYLYLDKETYFRRLTANGPQERGVIPGEATGGNGLPGRTINIPSEVDALAIVDWYEELLANAVKVRS
jgi:inosine-uridine nucleoside N-ribohydrolase